MGCSMRPIKGTFGPVLGLYKYPPQQEGTNSPSGGRFAAHTTIRLAINLL
ncbi:hypothetical protein L195_g011211 [Trifolium pratense]|uniref:Uncharacterized protein n=1 Tax=Trifolium pratense TaxID=57577 RepID=A0A2K3PGW0_TRIPR|nr:hypothetical protein L195_g011211 [Trifolium pratense]